MCGVGNRINVAVQEASRFEEREERMEMIERNDADVDWMRFGGEKGWTLELCTDTCQPVFCFSTEYMTGCVPRLRIL